MSSAELSAVFAEMADIMEVLGEDRFRVNSYRRAARTLSETTEDLAALAEAGRLESLPGIGKSTAAKIAEYLRTGQIAQHRQLREKVPPELMDLLAVQGLGPKTVAKLWREADIKSPGELRRALEVDPERLERLEGLGAKKVAQLREALQFAVKHELDNLTLIVDKNGLQAMDFTSRIMDREDGDLERRLRGFGLDPVAVDGHDVSALLGALKASSRRSPFPRPEAVLARTVKGYGVKCMENVPRFHFRVPTREEFAGGER